MRYYRSVTLDHAVRQPDGSSQQTSYFDAAKGWTITRDGDAVTVSKSIGEWDPIEIPWSRVTCSVPLVPLTTRPVVPDKPSIPAAPGVQSARAQIR